MAGSVAPSAAMAGPRVLVPVANPASLTPLLRCARRLAGIDGEVTLLTVLTPRLTAAERRERREQLAAAASQPGDDGRPRVYARCITADQVSAGVLQAASELAADLVLMGWKGRSSTSDVFGRLIDDVVGRSSTPLAILRPGTDVTRRVVFPVSGDHLLRGGERGLLLAADLAERMRRHTHEPATVLRTGVCTAELPREVMALGDRVHHDYRRLDHAVGAFTGPGDMIVAPVAPTVSGLRAATTHLAWSTPDAALLVAIDSGRIRGHGVLDAVADAGARRPSGTTAPATRRARRVAVTIRLPDPARIVEVEHALVGIGRTDHVMTWWPPNDGRTFLGATVHVDAASINTAIARLAGDLHEVDALSGAEISYDIEGSDGSEEPTPHTEPVRPLGGLTGEPG